MTTRFRARGAVAAALALAILPGCGGGGGNGPTTPPVTQAPAPVRTLIIQGGFSLVGIAEAQRQGAPADYVRHEFTTTGAGTLEVNADWTFSSTQMLVGVVRGACSFAQIDTALNGGAVACPEVGGTFPSPKPARVTITNLAAGSYTLVVANITNISESGNYQVFLTR